MEIDESDPPWRGRTV
jgi:hypothetical protein